MCNNMASESLTASLSFGRTFALVVFVCVTCFQTTIGYAPLLHVTCRSYLDLKGTAVDVRHNQYDAGLLETQLPLVIGPFVKEEDRCDITLGVPEGHGLMFYFLWMDYQDAEDPVKCSTASLQFFDGTPKQFVTGLSKPRCGQMAQMPKEVYYVKNSLLRIRIEAKNKVQGRGFMIHFNVFRNDPPCHSEEFLCHTQGYPRCIAEHLLCDGWNDCGDEVDEDQRCDYLSDGGIAVLVLGIFFLVAIIILIVVWCRKQKGRYWVAKEMKNMVEIRPSSLSNSREALEASFSVSSETLEKEKYGAHTHHGRSTSNGRHSGRRSRSQTPTRYLDDEDHDRELLPPYSEKSPMYREHASYEDAAEGDGRPRRSRRRSRTRDSVEGVEEEEGGVKVRGRRRRSRSREDRFSAKEEEEGEGRYPDERDNTQPRHPERRDDVRDSPRGAGDRRSGYDSRNNNDSHHDHHPDERRRHKPYDNDRYPPEDPRRREPYDERSPDDPRRKSFDERYPEELRLQHYGERYPAEERPRGPRPNNGLGYRSPEDRDSDSRHSRQSESYPNRYDEDRDRNNYDRDRNRDGYNGRDRDQDRERDRYSRRERDEDRDRYKERDSGRDHRDRDTDPDRERERDTDRHYRDDRDRDRDSRRERPRSRREEEPDRDSPRPEKDPHLHPRRDPHRRSPHVSDSDLDSSKDGRRASPKPNRDEERDSSSREDPYRAHNNSRSADRRSRPQNEHPPNKHLPAPTHSSSSDQLSDSRPQSRHVTPSDSYPPPDNDNEQDTPSRRRRRRRDRASSGERLPGSEQPPEDQDTPRRRRRRSRSREGQERARASRPAEEEEEEEEDGGAGERRRRGRQSRSSGLPAAEVGGYMEQSV